MPHLHLYQICSKIYLYSSTLSTGELLNKLNGKLITQRICERHHKMFGNLIVCFLAYNCDVRVIKEIKKALLAKRKKKEKFTNLQLLLLYILN